MYTYRPSEILDIISGDETLASKYHKLSRRDNIVIPIVDVIKEQKVSLFKIKRFILKLFSKFYFFFFFGLKLSFVDCFFFFFLEEYF